MSIKMNCPKCATVFEFNDDLAGKRIRCKSCSEIFRVAEPPISVPPASKPTLKPTPPVNQRADEPAKPSSRLSQLRNNSKPKPSSKQSTRDDIDEDDEDARPRRHSRDDDDEEDRRSSKKLGRFSDRDSDDDDLDQPKKSKKTGIIILAVVVPLLVVIGGGTLAFVFLRGGKKKDDTQIANGQSSAGKNCVIGLPEKDISQLVVSDKGSLFATFRKAEGGNRSYELEIYDIATGNTKGKHRLPEMETPVYVSMSNDGGYVLVEQEAWGGDGRAISVYSTKDQKMIAPKWNPYPKKQVFSDLSLYKAEFIGNDRIVTISTMRGMDIWQLPNFEPVVSGASLRSVGDGLLRWIGGSEDSIKYERYVAFTSDRSHVAMWTGDSYAVASSSDGAEVVRLPMASMNMKNAKAGGVAWSPDGKSLAMILEFGNFGSSSFALVIWKPFSEELPVVHQIYRNQVDQSKGLNWWGNKHLITRGGSVDGVLIDATTGKVLRQVMGPAKKIVSVGRDGRLWYLTSPEIREPGKVFVVDNTDGLLDVDPNAQVYEEVPGNKGRFLRRLWMEIDGIRTLPTRYDPPIRQNLISEP